MPRPKGYGSINVGTIYADLSVDSDDLAGGIARARTFAAEIRKELRSLDNALYHNTINQGDHAKQTAELSAELNKLDAALRGAYTAYSATGTAVQRLGADNRLFLNQFEGARNRMTELFVGLSYSMNDFFGTSGSWSQKMIAVANNMPMIFNGLTKIESMRGYSNILMGVGLSLSAILPIIAVIINNWDVLTKKFQDWTGISISGFKQAKTELQKYQEALKSLEDNENPNAFSPILVQRYKDVIEEKTAGQKEQERFRNEQTTTEQDKGKQVGDVIREIQNKDKVVSGLAGLLVGTGPGSAEVAQAKANLDKALAEKSQNDALRAFNPVGGFLSNRLWGIDAAAEEAYSRYAAAKSAETSTESGSPAAMAVGQIISKAKSGSGKEQFDAIQKLRDMLSRIGEAESAKKIDEILNDFKSSPEKKKEEKEKNAEEKRLSEEKEREDKRRRDDAASAVQRNYDIRSAVAGSGLTNKEVEDMLVKFGLYQSGDESSAAADPVRRILDDQYKKRLSELAAKENIGIDEAPARLLEMEGDKVDRILGAAEKKDNAEESRRRREAIDQGKKDIRKDMPGFNELTEQFVTRGMLSGMTPEEMAASIRDEIQLATDGKVNFVNAEIIAKDRVEGVQQKLSNLAYGMEEKGITPWRSEVFSGTDISRRIQQGVGQGQETKDQKELRAIRQILEQQNKNGILRLQIK